MQKLKLLRKKIIKEGGIAIGVIVALIAGMMFLGDAVTKEEQEQMMLRGNIGSLVQQISDLEAKHGVVTSSITEFRRLKGRQKRGDFTINRDQATDIFNTLRQKYRISNLSMTVTPKAEMSTPELLRPTAQMAFSEAVLEFDAMSDVHVFSFIQDAAASLPGFLRISNFRIDRQRKITNEVYVSVSKGELPRMVSAKVTFMWFGIDEKQKVSNEAPPPQ